tara:strand:+ start:4397 stop:4873 length:477 start_codon:yes stop_codon:yes gene_type:complete
MRNEELKWNKKTSLKGHAHIVHDSEKREVIVSIYRRVLRNVIFFKLTLTSEYPFSPPKAEISVDLNKWKLLHEDFFRITEGSIKNWRKKWGKYHCACCKSLLCADNWGPSLTILDISNELEGQIDEKIEMREKLYLDIVVKNKVEIPEDIIEYIKEFI